MFKPIRLNIEITTTPPRIARFRSNLLQSLTASPSIHYKCLRSKGQRSRPFYNTATIGWSTSNLASQLKRRMTGAASSDLKLQCIIAIATFSSFKIFDGLYLTVNAIKNVKFLALVMLILLMFISLLACISWLLTCSKSQNLSLTVQMNIEHNLD